MFGESLVPRIHHLNPAFEGLGKTVRRVLVSGPTNHECVSSVARVPASDGRVFHRQPIVGGVQDSLDSGSTTKVEGAAPQSHRQSDDHGIGVLPSKPTFGDEATDGPAICPEASAITTQRGRTKCWSQPRLHPRSSPRATKLGEVGGLRTQGRPDRESDRISSFLGNTSTNGPREQVHRSPSLLPRECSLGPNVSNHPSSSRCSLISA